MAGRRNHEVHPGGRPRDPKIDSAVIRATRELLEESGYAATTIQAVARRSGVATPAIYRRWPNRVQLIETAVAPEVNVAEVEHSGDLRADLQSYVDTYARALSHPAARAAFPALLSEYQRDPASNLSVTLRVGTGVRDAFRALLDSQPAGTIAPGIDPDFVLDLLIGSIIYRLFIRPFTGRTGRYGDDTAEVLYRALTCPGRSTQA